MSDVLRPSLVMLLLSLSCGDDESGNVSADTTVEVEDETTIAPDTTVAPETVEEVVAETIEEVLPETIEEVLPETVEEVAAETIEEVEDEVETGPVCAPEEICGNGIDDDCDGATDTVPDLDGDGFTRCGGGECCEGAAACGLDAPLPGTGACDADLAIDGDATAMAHAMGLCGDALVAARLLASDGTALPGVNTSGWGVLADFGVNLPREGARLAALSSGSARAFGDDDYHSPAGQDWQYELGQPAEGFPIESTRCPGVVTGPAHDGIALELEVRVPDGAHAFAFDQNVFFYEWPDYVCSEFNDFFLTFVDPPPTGARYGNVAVDGFGELLSVNSANVRVCTCDQPESGCATTGGIYACPLGRAQLEGTGFDRDMFDFPTPFASAATGWLTTIAPVEPGSTIKVRFVIYDSGDGILDATAIIDNWRWLGKEGLSACATPAFD